MQVYVSHVSLNTFHPIFCKFSAETVKTILQYGSIVYLNRGQALFAPGFNDHLFYFMLFGCCKLSRPDEQ